jgi:hypothetical protein
VYSRLCENYRLFFTSFLPVPLDLGQVPFN